MITSMPVESVILTEWNIVCVTTNGGDYGEVFIGYSIQNSIGRVSTKILDFDPIAGLGATTSGSRYRVLGEPGVPHPDAIYVLEEMFGDSELVRKELFSNDGSGKLQFKYAISDL